MLAIVKSMKQEESNFSPTSKQYKKLGTYNNELKKSLKKLETAFNKFICLRDLQIDSKDNVFGYCISSGKRFDAELTSQRQLLNGRKWHASHYYNADRYSSVRFDERNVNAQMGYLNVYHSGDKTNYQENLIKKIGEREFEKLSKDKNKLKKWDIIEVDNLVLHYREKCKAEARRLKIKL